MTMHDLQTALIKNNCDAYIVTRGNMFLGQDTLDEENKIKELCGFSGSAGTLLVFRDKAVLLVDGRYELQAAMEVDPASVSVVCTNDTVATWINNNQEQPCTFAYDPWCHSVSEVDYWNWALKKHTFTPDVKQILGPRLSKTEPEIFEHEIRFAGLSMNEKISRLTAFMETNRLDAYFMTECDAVSWLMNLRSNCLPDTPLLRAYALIGIDGSVSLFTNDFRTIEAELSAYNGKHIGIAFNQTPKQIYTVMKNQRIYPVNLANPVQNWKAVKNAVELQGFRDAHIRDGAAIVKFLRWLEDNRQQTDELGVVAKLHEFRSANENFFSSSFATIAASGPNGAIVHYHPGPRSNRKLDNDSLLLLDSGAQYYDGTTDITRTIALGKPAAEMVDSFTQVLKAHIAAATAVFPETTPGIAIDSIARGRLWKFGKDYKHGTGHGVGHFLNVHEGPQRLAAYGASYPLSANMITSIEPGYYQAGAYGIRIENLAVITAAECPGYLKFEPLTFVPIDKRLINKYLLSRQEQTWLNDYHRQVADKLSPLLAGEDLTWLRQVCTPL